MTTLEMEDTGVWRRDIVLRVGKLEATVAELKWLLRIAVALGLLDQIRPFIFGV